NNAPHLGKEKRSPQTHRVETLSRTAIPKNLFSRYNRSSIAVPIPPLSPALPNLQRLPLQLLSKSCTFPNQVHDFPTHSFAGTWLDPPNKKQVHVSSDAYGVRSGLEVVPSTCPLM